MKKSIIKGILGTLLLGSVLYFNNNIGIATVKVPAEDNCPENGYVWYCENDINSNKVFVDMSSADKNEKFFYIKNNGTLQATKLFKISI